MSTPYADTDNKASGSRQAPLRAVLRSRSYLLLWTAQFASLLAGFFNFVAVAWLTLQLTGSTLAVGSVLAAASVPLAVLMLLRSEEHTSELQSRLHLVCRLLLEKKKKKNNIET